MTQITDCRGPLQQFYHEISLIDFPRVVQESFHALGGRAITLLQGVANKVAKLFNSVEALTFVVQTAISASTIWQSLTSSCALKDAVKSLSEYRAISSATRIFNSVGYFFGGQLVEDIHNCAVQNIYSNIIMLPAHVSWVCGWFKDNLPSRVGEAVGSFPLFQSPLVESFYIAGSILGSADKVYDLISGQIPNQALPHTIFDLISTATDIVDTFLSVVPSVHPLCRAACSLVSSTTGTIAFFLNPSD